jgi:hypothetical protein
MPMCSITGNLQQLGFSLKREGQYFSGPFHEIKFVGPSEFGPREAQGYVAIFSDSWPEPRDITMYAVAAAEIAMATAERLMHMKNCAWIRAYKEDCGKLTYVVCIMLPRPRFEIFARMCERHFGHDVLYDFSFQYPLFSDGQQGRAPSSAQFYAGEELIAEDEEIELGFQPSVHR